jgi:hypothetical protein
LHQNTASLKRKKEELEAEARERERKRDGTAGVAESKRQRIETLQDKIERAEAVP